MITATGWEKNFKGRDDRQLARERNMRKEHFFAIETLDGVIEKKCIAFEIFDTLEEMQEAHKWGVMIQKKIYEYRNGERVCIGGVWDARWHIERIED